MMILDDTILSSYISLLQNPTLYLKHKARNWMNIETNLYLQPQETELAHITKDWEAVKKGWEKS